jgi:quinoprotein glucose dehydrogenase
MRQFLGFALATVVVSCLMIGANAQRADTDIDWSAYQGDPQGTHYSTLDQINTGNVGQLQVAWRFDSGDASPNSDLEGSPLVVRGRLYFASPKGRIFCLDAASGQQRWVFDPTAADPMSRARQRGLMYWSSGRQERILFTFKNRLIALDAKTGTTFDDFGDKGEVDLRKGMDRDPGTISVSVNSPGVIYKDLVILGSTGNTPGHIRAFDVRTGKRRWIFHTIPHPGELGHDTWPEGAWQTSLGANAWSGLTLDPQRGVVYLPLASAGMGYKDFYGADRPGNNLFGTSLVALDANTGKRLWHFQFVKHDLWDRDPPTPPTLVTVRRNGQDIPAIAQISKSGVVWVLNRITGESLFPLKQATVFPSTVPGEQIVPTQIYPAAPEPFARQVLTDDILTRRTPEAYAAVRERLNKYSNRGLFDPPSVEGTILFPGMDGGGEYGGAAWDPETGILYINANEMAWVMTLKPKPKIASGSVSGDAIYASSCAACHGAERKGNPPALPALMGLSKRFSVPQLAKVVAEGLGRMPGFAATLSKSQIDAVAAYVLDDNSKPRPVPDWVSTENDDYVFQGYNKFLDPDGYPAVSPPWGTLNALDLNTGQFRWRIPLGEYPELADKTTGSENYGGAVVTKGGVLFIAATVYDNKFRAFDKRTGQLLWETVMPASSITTPATYSVRGRQYVVVASGGGKNPKVKPHGEIIAYSLPAEH